MTQEIRARLCSASIVPLLLVGLLGCSTQSATVDEPPAQPDASTEGEDSTPSSQQPAGSVTVDPAWPWPSSLPRPSHPILSEFTSPNVTGEGAIYSLEFTVPSLEAAQVYADALRDAGLTWMLDGTFPEPEAGDTETSVVAMTEDYMCSLTVDSVTLHTEFSFVGIWK